MRAYSVPTLPNSVEKYYNNTFIRIFRFIGGLTVVLILTNFYLYLPKILHLFCAIVASIHVTQVTIIFIVKTFYSLHTLICKREKFQVRNSPLNKYASIISQALYCLKVGCGSTAAGASFIAAGASYDALLVESGREKVFLPMMSQIFTGVFGHAPQAPQAPYNQANNTPLVTEHTTTPKKTEVSSVTEMVSKYHSMSPSEKIDLMVEINSTYEDNNK